MATSSLENYKTEQQKLLESQQQKAKEQAELDHQKLMKYLPQRTAGQSLGMTESAKIAAYNALTEQKGAADAAYNRGVADLNNYVREQEQIEQEKADAKLKSEQDALYNEIMTTIDSGSWNASDELYNYLGVTKGTDNKFSVASEGNPLINGLSDTQRAQVMQRLQMYANNPEQQAADEAYKKQQAYANQSNAAKADTGLIVNANAASGVWNAGDNFSVKFDGTGDWEGNVGQKYRVESGGVLTSDESKTLAGEIAPVKEGGDLFGQFVKDHVYEHDGEYYVYNGGERFIKIQARANSFGAGDPASFYTMVQDAKTYKEKRRGGG